MVPSCVRHKLLFALAMGLSACSSSNLNASNGSDGGSSGGLNQGTMDGGGCPQDQTSCLGACVNTQTDTNNCGACGALCGNGQNCLAGVCTCPAGGSICGNSCTSLATDDHNCGSCNHACSSGQSCSDGGCVGGTPDAGQDAGPDGGSGLPDAGAVDGGEDAGTPDGGSTACTLANLAFGITAYPAGNQPIALAVGALRQDAGLDIVVANLSSNSGGIFLNIGNGRFGAQQTFTTDQAPSAVALADFNGDGLVDVALSATTSNTVDVRFGNGNGTFGAQMSYPVDDAPAGLAVGEFVSKGRPDLAVACLFGSDIDVLLNQGDGGFGPAVPYDDAGYGPQAVLAADLTGNGKLDLAAVNQANGGGLDILMGNGNGTFLPQIETPFALQGAAVVTDDFNGDHKPDIAVAYYGFLDEMGNEPMTELAVYLGDGNGSFQPPTTYPTTDTPFGLATGDINGDGIPDLVAAEDNGDVGIFLGNGDGTFQAEHLVVAGSGLAAAVVGDLNGDGKLDIAVADESGNALVVLLNRCP